MVGRSEPGGRAGGVHLSNQHWQGFCKNPWSQCRLEAGRGHQKVGKASKWGITSACGEQKGYQHTFIHLFIQLLFSQSGLMEVLGGWSLTGCWDGYSGAWTDKAWSSRVN